MRIVFFMRNVGYLRNFEWVIRRMAENGHSIRLLFDHEKKADDRMQQSSDKVAQEHLEVLKADHPKIGDRLLNGAYTKPRSILSIAARRIRLMQDYIRYLDPEFVNAHMLRERAALFLRPEGPPRGRCHRPAALEPGDDGRVPGDARRPHPAARGRQGPP